MATVRELRVKTARETLLDPKRFYNIIGLSYEVADMLAEEIVDALFPDHTFDNVEAGEC